MSKSPKNSKPEDDCNDGLTIDVIHSAEATATAVRKLITRNASPCKAFGLDCEWNINHSKGAPMKPDLLQIATPDGYCILFRLNILQTVPPELKSFLENPMYTKAGVAVLDDAMKLEEHYGVATKGLVDVRHLADEEGFDPRGLSALSESVLGETCTKYNWRFHYWTGKLSPEQKRYAAIDAVFGVRIFATLNHRRLCRYWGKEWRTWSDDEYNLHTLFLWEKYFGKHFDYSSSKFFIKRVVDDMVRLSDLKTRT